MMQQDSWIAITGAAGFIGSKLAENLNEKGFGNLVLVDDFGNEQKAPNLKGRKYALKIHRDQFFNWLREHPGKVQYIFHLGARTDTTEMNYEIHKRLNLEYTKNLWEICYEQQLPLVYASSAATYGDGAFGYKDTHDIVEQLQPLNPYGISKNEFDIWALQQKHHPPFWAGVKFFNVYGPNEYHKGRMASVIFHAYHQIRNTGSITLFRSHNPKYKDGEQLRDFIYVKDILNIVEWLMETQPESGLYNAGTGKARTFIDLAKAVFHALGIPEDIRFRDTPEDIRDKYQYFTEADMQKIKNAGYDKPFYSLEEGVKDYIDQYLSRQ
ncbi:ADP-glyceromanno-heptose 6-epimerase [Rurimicrobium arvi]|uniref:ADP-L-glycero-D-manno-heptose-6-epimerase n=1 Tax=Rurimicrobium arvi TaxID=2049916 RepID=A0ABP8MZ65_9BACT